MTCQLHDLDFSQSLGKPVGNASASEVVEFATLNASLIEEADELLGEVIEWTFAIHLAPPARLPALLNTFVVEGGHKDSQFVSCHIRQSKHIINLSIC